MVGLVEAEVWTAEWWSLQDQAARPFHRADQQKQAPNYVRGLLGQMDRNCWQLAEFAGQERSPDGMQHLLSRSVWDADMLRNVALCDVAEHVGPGSVLILDDSGFIGWRGAAVHRHLGEG